MEKKIISEGKTTEEAIEKGLKILNVNKNMVDIKVLEEEKRSFFSILTPRIVKVELRLREEATKKEDKNINLVNKNEKEVKKESAKRETRKIEINEKEAINVIEQINTFLTDFFKKQKREDIKFEVKLTEYGICVDISGDKVSYLIGYRGETMNALQVILTSIASKNSKERIKVFVDIENYREKRDKSLEDLAEKIAKTVIKTKKSITLEPMSSYERKIIHSKLQLNPDIRTYSIGMEPYRKVVIALK